MTTTFNGQDTQMWLIGAVFEVKEICFYSGNKYENIRTSLKKPYVFKYYIKQHLSRSSLIMVAEGVRILKNVIQRSFMLCFAFNNFSSLLFDCVIKVLMRTLSRYETIWLIFWHPLIQQCVFRSFLQFFRNNVE